jgi:hypothetical protein
MTKFNPNALPNVRLQTGLNQIRGINTAGSVGSGIPKQVSAISANVSNASTGLTSTVSVLFQRDPSDTAFSGVNVLVKGYQGNQTPTQLASGADSPIQFVVNNTGEALGVIVQSYGNGGSAPLGSCPTTGVTLPKSTGGGVGTSTVTSPPAVSGSAVAGQLAKFASPATTLTGANLSGDATTSNTTAVTVVGLQGKAITTVTPNIGDALEFNGTSWTPGMYSVTRSYRCDGNGTGSTAIDNFGTRTNILTGGTGAANKASATEPPLLQMASAAAVTTSQGFAEGAALGTNTGIFKRLRTRFKLVATGTNNRYWAGLLGQVSLTVISGTQYFADVPTVPTMAFRWSQGTDTNWKAFVGTGAAQTIVDTGIAPSTTASHVFEIAFDGTNVRFYIDAALVATISSNVPTASSTLGNSSFVGGCIYDNKNSINNAGILFSTLRIIETD